MTAVLTIHPVLDLLGVSDLDQPVPIPVAAERLDVHPRTLQRWAYGRNPGDEPRPLPVELADRIACTVLGLHPCEVWGNWWEAQEADTHD